MPNKNKLQTKKIKTEDFFRDVLIRQENIDEENRTVEITFSSEEPYERYWGIEILDHGKESVRLDRINTGGPLLVGHDTRDHIGVIEKAFIGADRRGHAKVRFGKSSRADEIFNDVVDGIKTSVSVGYRIYRMVLEKEEEGVETYRVNDWEPFEVSLVAVPADTSVGTNRADQKRNNETIILTKEKEKMPDDTKKKDIEQTPDNQTTATRAAEVDVEQVTRQTQEKELNRIRDIETLATRFNLRAEGEKAIKDGLSIDQFRAIILDRVDNLNNKPITVEDPEIGLTKKEVKTYSLFNALRAMAWPKNQTFQDAAAFEREVSAAAEKQLRQTAKGFIMPYDVYASREVPFLQQRVLSAGTATDGAELVADNLMAGNFIDVLRNLAVVMGLGARPLAGLVGDVLIPRKTSGSAAAWIATEGGDAAGSEPQFDQVQMTPKTLGAYADITRQLLLQSSLDVENMVREDLASGVAIAIDLASLYGSGASGQPTGVSQQTGINTPTNFAGAVPTWAEVVAMESAVAVDNALVGNLAYIMEPAMRGSLKTSPKESGYPVYIMGEDSRLNGYPAGVTSQITSGDLFFGNWRDLVIGFWGGLDVLIDPYTGSLAGTVRIVVHESIDIAVRHPVSFAFNNDGV